jgi:NMD protein affecting ribosome stability and mRNA decay
LELLDYCEHCGSTNPPKRRIDVNVKLEGTIRGDERDDREPSTAVGSDVWICSECGREVKVYGD